MKNHVEHGCNLVLTAPYAVSSGQGALIGSLFGVATGDIANGAEGQFAVKGVFDITALSTDTGSRGTKMYWDNTNKRLTTTSTSNTLIGCLVADKANGDTTARVLLNGTVA